MDAGVRERIGDCGGGRTGLGRIHAITRREAREDLPARDALEIQRNQTVRVFWEVRRASGRRSLACRLCTIGLGGAEMGTHGCTVAVLLDCDTVLGGARPRATADGSRHGSHSTLHIQHI